MYSILVTTLLSAGATAPGYGWFNSSGCNGCNGCYGSGSSSAGCVGRTGGGGFLGLGLLSRSQSGSCYGGSSCYGCSGSAVRSYSVPVIYGTGAGIPMHTGMPFPPPSMMMPGAPILPPAGLGGMPMPPAGLSETTAPPTAVGEAIAGPNQVTLVVTLPADARLYAEKELIPLTGPVRFFVTPELQPGRTYYYDLTIEVQRGGKPLRDTKSVELRVGNVSRVTFPEPAG